LGSSVPQQQVIRDFGRSRAKAHKDIRERLPVARRAGMPKRKSKREALPTLNYTRRGLRLKDGRLHLAGGIVVAVVWSRELPATTPSLSRTSALSSWPKPPWPAKPPTPPSVPPKPP
jgi:putative transposase